MMTRCRRVLHHAVLGNATTVDVGLLILRVFVGLAFMTIFEKVLPREGVWGPQPWFIDDVAAMGFPLPAFFAWVAVLSEFVGGALLILGLYARPAALMNCGVTAVALFSYHDGDVARTGLTAALFLIMCTVLLIAGPGRFSLDGVLARRDR